MLKIFPNFKQTRQVVSRKTLEESAYEPFSKSLRRGIPEMFFWPQPCLICLRGYTMVNLLLHLFFNSSFRIKTNLVSEVL
jgi:hypothetical protein